MDLLKNIQSKIKNPGAYEMRIYTAQVWISFFKYFISFFLLGIFIWAIFLWYTQIYKEQISNEDNLLNTENAQGFKEGDLKKVLTEIEDQQNRFDEDTKETERDIFKQN